MSVGTLLDSLDLEHDLGTGAMGRVIRATHRPSGTPLALKCVLGASRAARWGLQTELDAMASLHHPAILRLYDHGIASGHAELEDGTPWIALELASGGSLEDHPPRNWEETQNATFAVLDALAHAHARNRIHRDLKPANLMRCTANDRRPGLKLADFGIARAWQADIKGPRRAGTPAYMAPEQIRGAAQGPWTDLYTLGCVLWEWLCGEPPFGFRDTAVLLDAHVEQAVSTLEPRFDIPPGLETLVYALLQKKPAHRPASAAEVKAMLHSLSPGVVGPSTGLPASPPLPAHVREMQDLHGVGIGLLGIREPAVVGRLADKQALWDALRDAEREGRAQVVLLEGPIGSGRSRLAGWLCHTARELGVAEVERMWPTESGLGGLASRLAEKQARTDVDSASHHPDALFQVLRSDDRRRIVWLDDVAEHRDALRLLESIAYARPEVPLVVVATAAPEEPRLLDLADLPGVRTLKLGPLPRTEMSVLVREALGLSPQTAAEVVDRSDGIPGLAVSWIRSWVDRGWLVPSDEGLQRAPDAPERPPDPDVERVARLHDTLAAMGRRADSIRAGALLGVRVALDEWRHLTAALGLDSRRRDLMDLCRAGLVTRDHESWTLVDPGLRHPMLEPVRNEHWSDWNLAAAEALASFEPSIDRSIRRAEFLAESGQHDEAHALLGSLLVPCSAEDRLDDLHRIASIQERLPGNTPDQRVMQSVPRLLAIANMDSAHEAATVALRILPHLDDASPPLQIRVAAVCAVCLAIGEQPDEAERTAAYLPDDHLAKWRSLALVAQFRRDFDRARDLWTRLGTLDDDLAKGISAHQLAHLALLEGDPETAEPHLQRALAMLGDERGVEATIALTIYLQLMKGDFTDVAGQDALFDRARERGSAIDMRTAGIVCVLAAAARGDRERLEQARPAAFQQRPMMAETAGIVMRLVETVVGVARSAGHDWAALEALALGRRIITLSGETQWSERLDLLEA